MAQQSQETRALKSLQSKRYPDANKDFKKNNRRVNNAIDYMSAYMQKMQAGIDAANQNVFEQIGSFVKNLVVLFAGGEPTGIDIGDLKYIFQALGAMFGFTGPFPFSIVSAVLHFFENFLAPLPQLSDLIFDAILAWAEDIGFSGPFVETLSNLAEAFSGLFMNIFDFIDAINDFFSTFVHGIDFGILGVIANKVFGMFDGVDTGGFGNILDLVEGVMEPFIVALDWITSFFSGLFSFFGGEGVGDLEEVLEDVSNGIKTMFNRIQDIIDGISRAVGGPLGAFVNTVFTNIGKIFGLASGADTKANLILKKVSPLWESVDGNGEVSLLLSTADTLMTINATNSRGAFIRCRGGDLKQTISCIVKKTGTVTTFNIDIYQLLPDGSTALVYSTPNIQSLLATVETVMFYEMPIDDAYVTNRDANYLAVARMTGSGSIQIQGKVYPVGATSTRPLYPGYLRDPSGTPAPATIASSIIDSMYVKETPYFQIGSLADIIPQSFYNDFSTLSSNLWSVNKRFVSGLGGSRYPAVANGLLDLPNPTGGVARGWVTHKFCVATNRCRVGVRPGEPFLANNRSAMFTLFSPVDKAGGIGIKLLNDGSDTMRLCIVVDDGTVNDITAAAPIGHADGDLVFGTPGFWTGRWIYLEYDPTDGHYRVYVDPDFDDPDHRLMSQYLTGTPGPGSCIMDFDETLDASVAAVLKTSITRSSTILFRVNSGSSIGIDDWILQDYVDPSA